MLTCAFSSWRAITIKGERKREREEREDERETGRERGRESRKEGRKEQGCGEKANEVQFLP